MRSVWDDVVVLETMQGVGRRLGAVIPNVLSMLALLLLGLAIGAVARALVVRVLRAVRFAARCERWGVQQAFARAGILREPEALAGSLVFWGIFLLFAMMGIDALALPGMSGATSMAVQLIPNVLAAALMLVVGWLLANFLSNAVLIGSVNARIAEARLLARAVRWAVLAFTLAAVLTQLGIGREMVMIAFGLTFGGVVFTFALAFGLGARDLAREILERRFRQRESAPEDDIAHL
jgi:Mechanosensitive ion channel, conserved TM helix